jgi:hypothetical protein
MIRIKLKDQLKKIVFLSISLVFAAFIISCEKEPDELGLNIIPDEDNFFAKTETTTGIIATTVKNDSIISFYPDTSLNSAYLYKSIIGDYSDLKYGNTKASLLLNFYADSINHDFGNSPVVDSLILYLRFDSVFGEKNASMSLRISELKQSLSYKKIYYSNINENEYKGSLVIDTTIQFKDTSLIKIAITNKDFITKLLNAPKTSDTTLYRYNLHLQEYFKGFMIEASKTSGKGALAYIYPWTYNSTKNSKLVLYYKNTKNTNKLTYGFLKGAVRVTSYKHNYSGTPIETALQNTELGQKITYVQGMGGVSTRIRIPDFTKVADLAPVAINKAELIIPAIDNSVEESTLFPKRLAIMAINSSGKYSNIEYLYGQTFLDGIYDANKNIYTFNLTLHLQNLVKSKLLGSTIENTDFIVVVDGYKTGFTNSISRVPLDFSADKGAKFVVTYSKQ